MTENINDLNRIKINIERVDIPVFSSEDYIRTAINRENNNNFLGTYEKMSSLLLKGKSNINNSLESNAQIKNKIVFIVNFLVKIIRIIYTFYRYMYKILYKIKELFGLFKFKK